MAHDSKLFVITVQSFFNIKNTQSWTALFRAFSSHRQPSAFLIKGIPQLFFCGFLEMCGVCGMVVGVVLRAADTFSSIHSRSK